MVSIVVSAVGLVFLFAPDLQPEPEPPGLELVDFDLDKQKNIQADWTSDGEKGVMKDWETSLVTVMLRNGGDNPVLVKHADFRFSSVVEVGCPYGAGGSEVQARYDIKVPTGAKAPFTRTRKMKYTVPPHKQEQVAFTVGPKSVFAGALPQVYTFKITLHLSDGSRIEVPEMTYLDPSNTETVLESAAAAVKDGERYAFTTVDCVKQQERKARKIVQGASHVSPELTQYSAELTRLVGPSPSGGRLGPNSERDNY
ncbi:hypothetical protein ABZ371_09870 [Streptomyces sp. NPDC005899]|uniref:hypothetical protein n=1 Tax=Streptomyces sp. NPDC005899 TaxID=3155716 RepID=UPI0033F77972